MVIWFIGLSGSGKTTLGSEVARLLKEKAPNTVIIDGDEIRKIFGQDKGVNSYSIRGRRRNAERIVSLCETLDNQGLNVVCCVLSIFQDIRTNNRNRFSKYFEIFIDVPLAILKKRDIKNLYEEAERGEKKNVVGIDIPYQRPLGSDLVVDHSYKLSDIKGLARKIINRIGFDG